MLFLEDSVLIEESVIYIIAQHVSAYEGPSVWCDGQIAPLAQYMNGVQLKS